MGRQGREEEIRAYVRDGKKEREREIRFYAWRALGGREKEKGRERGRPF